MSGKNINAFFKDGTKIIYRPNDFNFIYLDKDSKITNITLNNNNKDIKKKLNYY